jgi:hypothetical protein
MMTIFGLALAKSVDPVSDEPARELNFRNLSVNDDTRSLFANFSTMDSRLTFEVFFVQCFSFYFFGNECFVFVYFW